ncbi:hypothetical protein [Duganella rivi]|nr:hypothetical protein [Duganella rivi]
MIIPPGQRAAHNAGMANFARGGSCPFINARVRVTAMMKPAPN